MWKNHGDDDSSRSYYALGGLVAFLVPAAAVAAYHFFFRKKSKMAERRVSFTSLGIAMGTFPIPAKVPDAVINAACYFGTSAPPTVEAIASQIVEPLLKYERLSSVLDIAKGKFRPCNRPYQPQDLIRAIDTQSSDESVLHQTIFAHVLDPLTHDKRESGGGELPWWEILVVHNRGMGPSALVIRVHHALADGLALVHAFESIFTNAKDGSPIQLPMPLSRTPSGPQPGLLSKVWALVQATFHVLTLGATKYDDDTAFSRCNHARMEHSGQRDFVMFPTIPLSFIKALKMAANCTVNDIVTTAVSQAIHDYCVSQDDELLAAKREAIQCRALLPVGFPRTPQELSDSTTAMRNKWCMVSCDIAVGCRTVTERLEKVRGNTTSVKGKPRAIVQLAIQNTIPRFLPNSIGRQAVMDVFSRHSLVLTNVPGPDLPVALAGVPMRAVQLYFNNLVSQVNILSYNGQVYGNIVYDPLALPPEAMHQFGRFYTRALLRLADHFQVDPPHELMQYM
jgi:diacylglycerol O-acyltransferase / wax synthase